MQAVTLCFLRRAEEVLLIEKQRGLGAGLVNGPGGKVEAGESPRECAAREVREEVGLEVPPQSLEKAGLLEFELDGEVHSECHVFRGDSFDGTVRESPEARPIWTPIEAVPYDRMWPDDRLWLPPVLSGVTVSGSFAFEGGTPLDEAELISHTLETGVDAGGL
ncbi:MAG: 8-oxo-dGTP diphosphatase [Natrialbaceae archaeon]|nr:8-oxo-dGTP diphosphatase [Natrialbaceae archaeon]